MSEIYIAGRLDESEDQVEALANRLEARGHVINYKWWEADEIPKPYLDNLASSSAAAEIMITFAKEADVFILLPNKTILGAAVEFGAALASKEIRPEKRVIVIGAMATRQSVFYAHTYVEHLNSIEDLEL